MARGAVTLEEVIRLALEARLAQVNIALPGVVEFYDADKQVADVRPMLRRAVPTPEEDYILEDLPVIPAVRVIHPGGAEWAIHVPLKPGDEVQLLFQQWDPSEYFRTGELAEPADKRVFSLAHAVCVPGLRTEGNPIAGASADDLTIRHRDGFQVTFKGGAGGSMEVGGNSKAPSLADLVRAELVKIQTALNSATAAGGGAAVVYGTPYTAPVSDSALASSRLKVGG